LDIIIGRVIHVCDLFMNLWGAQFHRHQITAEGAKCLLGAPKSPNNVASTFYNTVTFPPKNLRFEHGGTKLASCPRHHLASLRPFPTSVHICPTNQHLCISINEAQLRSYEDFSIC